MILDLGVIKVPFEGQFNFAVACAGIGHGLLWTVLVFCLADVKGPALYQLFVVNSPGATAVPGDKFIEACGKTMVVTAMWCFLYYNYVACQVGAVFNSAVFQMFSSEDVTEKYAPNCARWAGNMFEQSPVFLVCVWTYTLLVDYETGGYLGILYIVTRLVYPFLYMYFRQFTMWFEFITQTGYGVNGVFILGIFMNGVGGGHEFAKFAKDNAALAAILGFLVGSLGIFPYANPISIIYGLIHYKCDRRAKLATVAAVVDVGVEKA